MATSPVERPAGRTAPSSPATVAVVVLTHNRVHLLRKCVENVLGRASEHTTEIVIWNNGSTDGTREYLDSLDDPRLTVVHCEENVGQNGYARGFALTSADYLVELDDDVVSAPERWDEQLLEAYVRLPAVGFLAADIEDDPHDLAARYRYRVRPHEYVPVEVNGVPLLEGPAGGACAMTSRELYDLVGGFRQSRKSVFWQEEPAYIEDIKTHGYGPAVLRDLKVHHTGGDYYGAGSAEKAAFWRSYWRMRARREAVKRLVFRVPGFRQLNDRYAWFVAPS